MSCAASVHGEAQTISDPVQFIVDQGGVERDDALSVVKFDWNEDAQDDYFIIVESERAGAKGSQVARLDEIGGKQVVIAVGNRGVVTPINGYLSARPILR